MLTLETLSHPSKKGDLLYYHKANQYKRASILSCDDETTTLQHNNSHTLPFTNRNVNYSPGVLRSPRRTCFENLHTWKFTKYFSVFIITFFVSFVTIPVFLHLVSDDSVRIIEYDYHLDEYGMLECCIIPHYCNVDERSVCVKLKPSINHNELLFFSDVPLQKDSCTKGKLIAQFWENKHTFEIKQQNWLLDKEEEASMAIFRNKKEHYDGVFPLGEKSFIWNHFNECILTDNLMMLSHYETTDFGDSVTNFEKKNTLKDLRENSNMIYSSMSNLTFFSGKGLFSILIHIDVLCFIVLIFLYTLWCLSVHNSNLEKTVRLCIYIVNVILYVSFFGKYFMKDIVPGLDDIFTKKGLGKVVCFYALINCVLETLNTRGIFFSGYCQHLFWLSTLFISTQADLMVSLNILISLCFIIQVIVSIRNYNVSSKERFLLYIYAIWCFTQSISMYFTRWVGFNHKHNPNITSTMTWFLALYGILCPMISLLMLKSFEKAKLS